MSEPPSWLLLLYRLPSEPSRIRTTVWRRLRALGAVNPTSSVAALPASVEAERALRGLRVEIVEMGGSAQLARAELLVGNGDLVERYNAARNDEYGVVIWRSQQFLEEIAKETRARNFSYAELEEVEDDLTKLRGWMDRARARDVFRAPSAEEAERKLAECAEALDCFRDRVYATDAD